MKIPAGHDDPPSGLKLSSVPQSDLPFCNSLPRCDFNLMHLEATEHPLQHLQPAQTHSACREQPSCSWVSLKPAAGQTKHNPTEMGRRTRHYSPFLQARRNTSAKGGTNHGGATCPCSCAPSQAPCGSRTPVPLNLPLLLWQDLQEGTLPRVSSHVTHKGRRAEPWLSPPSPLPGIPWLSSVLGCAQAQEKQQQQYAA